MMARAQDNGRKARTFAVALLLLPFLAVQLFAPGTMPRSEPGGFVVQLCTSDGIIRSVVIGRDGVPQPVNDTPADDDHGDTCPWAAAARVFAALAAPSAPDPVLAEHPVDLPTSRGPSVHAALLGVPQARAPPVPV